MGNTHVFVKISARLPTDGVSQHWLVGPDVGGPAPPADRGLPAGYGRSGSRRGRHRAQHAAAETKKQHFVSKIKS